MVGPLAEMNSPYRRALGQPDGWAHYVSTTAMGMVCFAAEQNDGPWFLALEHLAGRTYAQLCPS